MKNRILTLMGMFMVVAGLVGCGTDEIPTADAGTNNNNNNNNNSGGDETEVKYMMTITTPQGIDVTYIFALDEDSTYTASLSTPFGGAQLEAGSYSISGATVTFTASGDCIIQLTAQAESVDCPDPYEGTFSGTTLSVPSYRGDPPDGYGDLDMDMQVGGI